MTITVVLLFVMGVSSTGLSYTDTIKSLVQTNADWFVPHGIQTAVSFAFLWGITTFTLPHVTMTALTYKDTATLHRAIKIGTVVVAIWLIGLNGLCFVTKYVFPEGTLATPDLASDSGCQGNACLAAGSCTGRCVWCRAVFGRRHGSKPGRNRSK